MVHSSVRQLDGRSSVCSLTLSFLFVSSDGKVREDDNKQRKERRPSVLEAAD